RNNLTGTTKIYDFFQGWIDSKSGGTGVDGMIQSGFDTLNTLYMADQGNALPPVPSDWSSDEPSQADLQTPSGMVCEWVHQAVDRAVVAWVGFEMNEDAPMVDSPECVEA